MSGSARRGYQDGDGRTYVASQPFKLSVAEPHVEVLDALAAQVPS
jgi:hypothetical protein